MSCIDGVRNSAKRTVVSRASRHSSGERCCVKESIKIKKKVAVEGQITKNSENVNVCLINYEKQRRVVLTFAYQQMPVIYLIRRLFLTSFSLRDDVNRCFVSSEFLIRSKFISQIS